MDRCHVCGGAAHPALPHLHGFLSPLCWSCTQQLLPKYFKKAHEQHIPARPLPEVANDILRLSA